VALATGLSQPVRELRAMKFGKDLENYIVKGWEGEYIDYKGLKTILKRLEDKDADVEEIDSDFFVALEEELEKVNRAFHEKCVAMPLLTALRRHHISVSVTVPPPGGLLPFASRRRLGRNNNNNVHTTPLG